MRSYIRKSSLQNGRLSATAPTTFLDYIDLDGEHAIFEIPIPQDWPGRTVGRIDIRKKYGIDIMGVKKEGQLDLAVRSDTVLTEDMTLLVLGRYRELQKCFHI